MNYAGIIGHREAKERLSKMATGGRVPHALLLSGQPGGGNLPLAHAFAQHLLCRQPSATGPCETCGQCLSVAKLAHPDLHLTFPIAKSKDVKSSDDVVAKFREAYLANPYLTLESWFSEVNAENKQPVIPVEEAAGIVRKLSYTSYEGSYKVLIVWLPEKMNADAANKLLKVLEEPPEKTVFILVSDAPDRLMATIISRVQQLRLSPNSDQEIADGLCERFGVAPESAMQAARLAQGNFSEAVSVLNENDENVSFFTDFQSFMRLAFVADYTGALDWVEKMAVKGREYHKRFLQYGLQIFRDCLVLNFADANLVRTSSAELDFMKKFAPFVNPANYRTLIEEFNSNCYYVERNANPKILFLDFFMRVAGVIRAKA